jgi:WD40 repeat protein
MRSGSRTIARGIRDMLVQHCDVFSTIDPSEIHQQISVRLAADDAETARYLDEIQEIIESKQILVPWNIRLDRDRANFLTLQASAYRLLQVRVLPGRRAISASWGNTLSLWDLVSGQCVRVLEGHSRPVYSLAVLPNNRAISTSFDRTLRLWDLASGRCLRVMPRVPGIVQVSFLNAAKFRFLLIPADSTCSYFYRMPLLWIAPSTEGKQTGQSGQISGHVHGVRSDKTDRRTISLDIVRLSGHLSSDDPYPTVTGADALLGKQSFVCALKRFPFRVFTAIADTKPISVIAPVVVRRHLGVAGNVD